VKVMNALSGFESVIPHRHYPFAASVSLVRMRDILGVPAHASHIFGNKSTPSKQQDSPQKMPEVLHQFTKGPVRYFPDESALGACSLECVGSLEACR